MTHKPTEELDRFPRKIWTDKKYPFRFTILGPVSENSIEWVQKIESQELLKVAVEALEKLSNGAYEHIECPGLYTDPWRDKCYGAHKTAREALAKIKEYFGESENSVTANKNI